MSKRAEKPEWLRVAEDFEASGQTQREFARRRGLRLSTFQSCVYRRRRQVGAGAELPVRLSPVQMSRMLASDAAWLEVTLGSGVRMRFSPSTHMDYVARLVVVLERGAC